MPLHDVPLFWRYFCCTSACCSWTAAAAAAAVSTRRCDVTGLLLWRHSECRDVTGSLCRKSSALTHADRRPTDQPRSGVDEEGACIGPSPFHKWLGEISSVKIDIRDSERSKIFATRFYILSLYKNISILAGAPPQTTLASSQHSGRPLEFRGLVLRCKGKEKKRKRSKEEKRRSDGRREDGKRA